MLISRLLEEAWAFRGWKHHESRPWPRHQNDTVHWMLSVTIQIESVCVPRKIMDYTVTWWEPTSSTNILYSVFILLKSLPPGDFEKSSITDQISFLTPESTSLRQNCLSIAKSADYTGTWKTLHLIIDHWHVVQLRTDCFVQTLDELRIVCVFVLRRIFCPLESFHYPGMTRQLHGNGPITSDYPVTAEIHCQVFRILS